MKTHSFRKIFFSGFAFAIPFGVVIYVLIRFVVMFEKLAEPVAKRFHIQHLFGGITVTVIAVLFLMIIVLLFGLLMLVPAFSHLKDKMEGWVFQLIPSLNQLKVMASEKLNVQTETQTWKPVLIEHEGAFSPAFIVEENENWISYMMVKLPHSDADELTISARDKVRYREISMLQMRKFNRMYGKGYVEFMSS